MVLYIIVTKLEYILIHNKAIIYNIVKYENTANNNVANHIGTIVFCFLPNPNCRRLPSDLYNIEGFVMFITTNTTINNSIETDK
jgi:hypothetical protein